MSRQARLDVPGTLHHVIMRGIEKQRIFNDEHDKKDFVNRLGHISQETHTPIYAWALMTNHAHIFIRSGPEGLTNFMRRLLTGYAISYNRRHNRHGYLFQNRYKSLVCEEDTYFMELVRYIHLNPLRAGLVKSIEELDEYPWSGHAALCGIISCGWQDTDYVLGWFGKKIGEAKLDYHKYIKDGISKGRRPELVGGGLLRSNGSGSEVNAKRHNGIQKKADVRILGRANFVESIIHEVEENQRWQSPVSNCKEKIQTVIKAETEKAKVSIDALKNGSRRREVSIIRQGVAKHLVEKLGFPQAEVARELGVSRSAITKLLRRKKDKKN